MINEIKLHFYVTLQKGGTFGFCNFLYNKNEIMVLLKILLLLIYHKAHLAGILITLIKLSYWEKQWNSVVVPETV